MGEREHPQLRYWDIDRKTRERKANEPGIFKRVGSSSSSSSDDSSVDAPIPSGPHFAPKSPILVESPPDSPSSVDVDMAESSSSSASHASGSINGSGHDLQNIDMNIDNLNANDQGDRVFLPPILDFDDTESGDNDDSDDESDHEDYAGNNDAGGEDDVLAYDGIGGDPIGEDPLYLNARLTRSESYLSILALAQRHKLNGSCVADIVKLIDLHCPEPTLNVHSFHKHFAEIKTPMESLPYCNECYKQCNEQNVCESCGETSVSYLTQFPIISQLKQMFSRTGFYDKLNYRFTREKVNVDNLEDIYDGQLYKDQIEGFLDQQSSVSFMWYADGASVFKSSKTSAWFMYLSINELPIEDRLLKENIVFAGLWVGPVKPPGNLMLAPLHNEMRQLWNGIPIVVPNHGEINLRGLILCGTADTPAREMFMFINQHTGECSCTKCKARGERVENVQVFPFEPEVVLRSDESVRRDAAFAIELQQNEPDGHVNGVKGLTEFANLVPNFVRAIAIDEMHDVQGVIKKLLKLWFDPSYNMFHGNRSQFLTVVDERIEGIKAPMFIKRKPRSLRNHLAYYKMSELKSLGLLYYLPVLKGILSEDHLRHYSLLAIAVWLLSRRSVSTDDVNLAERLINEFVRTFADLYDVKFLTINVHQLIHLAPMVRDLGPLPVTSCVGFEDLNGQILDIVHGTRFTEKQISSGVQLYLAVPQLVNELDDGPAKDFCSEMLQRGRKPNITERIDIRTGIVGSCKRLLPY